MNYKYYIVYDEEADGWDLFVYDSYFHQFTWRGIFDNYDEAVDYYTYVYG